MNDPRPHITIQARLEFLPPVLCFVEELARVLGFEKQERLDLRLALEETLGNVIKHGFADDPSGIYDLWCEPLATGLAVIVREKGMPFDPEDIPEYDPAGLSLEREVKGLGTFLTRKAVDEVVFENLGREGREIRLTKHLASKHVAGLAPGAAASAAAKARTEEAGAGFSEYSVRRLRPEDALEVSRCVYKTYGYTYEDFAYRPESIVELNRRGEMISKVAVADNGAFLGHCALKTDHGQRVCAELGVLVVAPEFRGRKVAQRLVSAMVQEAADLGLASVFCRAVLGHEISQKLFLSMGFRPCGILLSVFPREVEFRRLTGVISQKMSSLALWRPIQAPRERVVHPPAAWREWTIRLYKGLGAPFSIAPEPTRAVPCAAETRLRVRKVEILNIAEMDIYSAGPDAARAVAGELRRLRLEGTDAIYAHLDLEDPGSRALAEAMAEMGFIFAGVLPDRINGRDALILQYINNLAVDYEQIRLERAETKALLDYVRSQDQSRDAAET
ncbi:MAG: GNAT family N-acetyltransferase [Desulfovibrionaceae bacterium]|nr:GNAT family N-acetyltransferase [Desulfovibrionaceae bacterium]